MEHLRVVYLKYRISHLNFLDKQTSFKASEYTKEMQVTSEILHGKNH